MIEQTSVETTINAAQTHKNWTFQIVWHFRKNCHSCVTNIHSLIQSEDLTQRTQTYFVRVRYHLVYGWSPA